MKTILYTIKNFAKRVVMALVAILMVSNAWGADVEVSFASWVASIQNYNSTEWTDNGCTFTYASNNQTNWAYVRCGGKGTGQTSTIKYNSQVTIPVESVILNSTSIGNGSSSSITITGISVSAYSDAACTSLVGSKDLGTLSYTSSNCPSSFTITPNSPWANNLYYIITISWDQTGTKNCGLNISSITFKEASSPTLYTVTFNPQGGVCPNAGEFTRTSPFYQIDEASGGAGITLPHASPSAACTSEGWGFYGWATSAQGSETSSAPAIVGKPGDTYHPTDNITLHAVYAKGEYTKETSAITSGSKYLIVANSGGHNHIMKSSSDDFQDYSGYNGMAAIQIDETSTGKYHAASVNATWCYSIEGTAGNYFIRDVVNSSSSNYADLGYSAWWGHAIDNDDKYTITVSSGIWTIQNNYYDDGYTYLGYDSSDDAFFGYGSAKDILLYKAGTISYYSTPSCCEYEVSFSESGSSNISSMSFSASSVATCGDAASRTITITVTPSSGYTLFGDTKPVFTPTSGTPSATIGSVTDNGNGTFSYECTFAQNANGAGTFAISPGQFTNYRTICSTKYDITLTDDGEVTGGLFSVTDGESDVEEASEGDVLVLEAAPNTGYEFTNWEITYTDSGDDAWDDVEDTGDATDDEIIIAMPAADITVNAVFSCISTTVTVGPTTAAGNYGWRYTTGETIDITCSATGATPTGYQWQKYIGSAWEDIDGATSARFQKASCTSSDGGSYRCVVTTGTGCSFSSDGYFIRIFTFDGNYSGESWTKNAITWTGENTGTVTLSLDESSIYEFKVYDNDGKTFGNGTNNYIIQPVNWDCGTGNFNCRLFTGPEGNYTFTLNISHAGDNSPYVNVQVAYPSVTHPVEGYAYVSKWWDCYPHFWDGSGNALTPDGYDPQLTTYTTICENDYWYFPVLATYVNVAVKDNATWASASNNSGNQTTTDHSGMYLTHDGSWGWHDFATYSITFAGNGNDDGSMTNVNGICPNANRTLAENGYTKTGYHFNGWKTNVAITINTGGDDESIAVNGIVPDEATIKGIGSNITLTAQWAANTNTAYTVKHYKQKLDGTYDATPDDTDNLTGTTGASITPDRKSYTGFTAPSGTTTTILADGSRVVEYQYTRNSYTLAWSLDGGEISVAGTTAGPVKYEASLTAPTVVKTGYTFASWSPSVPSTMPAANSTYTATWTANTNTAYTVKHYKQKLDGTYDASPDDTDNLTGTTGASITPDRKSYEGFTAPSGTTTTILADGSRVVEYQYTRNSYNIAVQTISYVTIKATPTGESAISEGYNADAAYGNTITLNYSSKDSRYIWGGWRVTKADDASVSVCSSTSNNATFSMPAYAVKVTAYLYSDAIAWCDPDVTVTGDVHLTSTKDVYVNTTSGAGNLLKVASTDLGSATSMDIAYLNADAADAEVDKAASAFRLYASDASAAIDASSSSVDISAARTFDTDYSMRYTPTAYSQYNNYKLQLTFKKGDKVLKTVKKPIYGRGLPEEFVIAVKKGDIWVALPNDLATTSVQPSIVPQTITVDNTTTPTEAVYAPSTTVYKAMGRKDDAHISTIRFTTTGSNYLQVSGTANEYNMWLSTTHSANVQDWQLKSLDGNAYEVTIPSTSETKKMGIYQNTYMGYHGSPNYADIYFLPITNTFTEIPATVHEWGEHGAIIAADMTNVASATMHVADGSAAAATLTAVNAESLTAGKYVRVYNADVTVGAIANENKQLYVHWKNAGGDELGVSQVTIPRVIATDRTANKTNDDNKSVWNTEVHVLPGATLTIDGNTFVTGTTNSTVNVKELHVYPGATVNVSTGTLAATTLRLHNGWTRAGDKQYNTARVYINATNHAALTKTTASMDWDIYEQSEGKHYYPFAVPFETAVSSIDYAEDWITEFSTYGTHYGIDYYDGATRAEAGGGGWKQVASDATLQPGRGYTITALPVKGEAILRIPLTFDNGWTSDGEKASNGGDPKNVIEVTAYGGAAATGHQRHAGWNMLGVPFMSCYGNVDDIYSEDEAATLINGDIVITPGDADPYSYDNTTIPYVSVPSHDFAEYIQTDITEAKLRPGWSFFVQVGETGNLTFAVSNQQADDEYSPIYAPRRAKEEEPVVRTGIILSDQTNSDKTTILVSNKYSTEYEIGADLEKMFGNGYTLATYSVNNGMRLAFNAMSKSDAQQVIPIGYRAPAAGEYTFSLNTRYASDNFERIDLIDYQEGTLTNLKNSSYTFESTRTQNDSRFALNVVLAPKTPTDVDNIFEKDNAPEKVMIDGILYIIRGGVMYDSTGKKVHEINK